jgi:hypothetical protein
MRSLPTLSEQDTRRLSRMITEEQLLPVLNNTKWASLIEAMLNAREMKPQFRTRSVFAPPGFVTDWDGDWYYHIHPVLELEWVELRAASRDWLFETLRLKHIPFTEVAGVVRVWGYTRPGVQPQWL